MKPETKETRRAMAEVLLALYESRKVSLRRRHDLDSP
jgi:hypothetical protein